MKTLPATTQRAVKPCLSPVAVWQMLLTRLLEQHYGLTLNDTPFSEERVIQEHIDAGISLADAVNFLVENTNWCVSTGRDLTGRNNRLIFGLSIFCERGRQLACCSKAVAT
jgi:hypothetical protein